MKKLLTTITALLIATCMLFMTGCSSVFNGNFVEASAEEVMTFAAQANAVEENEDFDYTAGAQLKTSIYAKHVEGNASEEIDLNMDYKMVLVDGDMQAQGTIKMKLPEEIGGTTNATFWQKGGFMYMKGTSSLQEGEIKAKYPMSFDDMFGGIVDEFSAISLNSDIYYYLELVDNYEDTVKFYIEKTETSNKIKIEIPEKAEEGVTVSLSVVLVYDANFRINAVKVSMSLVEESSTMKINFEIQGWEGTIELPADHADYTFAGM